MDEINKLLIKEIKDLADYSIADQLQVCDLLRANGFRQCNNADLAVFLPLFIKFMQSKDHWLQCKSVSFIKFFTSTSYNETTKKENSKLAIEAGILPHLVKLLSSKKQYVLFEALQCLSNITSLFSKKVVENQAAIPSMIKCLKSKNEEISRVAVLCIANISKERDNITLITEAVEPLIDQLKSSYKSECALIAFINIASYDSQICQLLLNYEILKPLKKVLKLDSGYHKLLVLDFIEAVMLYNDTKTDMIIDEGFVPLILTQTTTKCRNNFYSLRIVSIAIIRNIIKYKRVYVSTLINEYDLISLLSDNLQTDEIDVIETALSALHIIFDMDEYKEICCQKFKECGGPGIINNLLKYKNEKICKLSNCIKDFVDSGPGESNCDADGSELNDDVDNNVIVEPPKSNRKRSSKSRIQEVEEPKSRSKRFKVSPERPNNEQNIIDDVDFDSPEQNQSDLHDNTEMDNDEELYNDFDDVGSPPAASIPNFEPAIPEETNTVDEAIPNDVKPPSLVSPIVVNYPAGETRNENIFSPLKYYGPSEHFLDECCKNFGLKFDIEEYFTNFRFKIKITQISSDSKPDNVLELNDESGFGCLSFLLTGNENNAKTIRKQLNDKFVDGLTKLDKEKIKIVMGSEVLIKEHFEAFSKWFECRILVYCNGVWKKYGNWNSEVKDVPLFVMEKKENGSEIIYQIILSLKNQDV